MARVLALTRDLLFGSQVQGALGAAGHDVVLLAGVEAVREALAGGAELLIVDLTDADLDGSAALEALRAGGGAGAKALGYYSHVEPETRARAQRAGFDLVVPRSRMAREGAALVASLL
jgi:CheY-like chemotaxis protein